MPDTTPATGNGEDDGATTGSGLSHEPGSGASGRSLATAQPAPAAAAHEAAAATVRETPAAGWARAAGYLRRTRDLASLHRVFAVALVLAAALRTAIVIGFQPLFWYPDSTYYLRTALDHTLDIVRPCGYSGFLAILRPFHSFILIGVLQHLMGLSTGIVIYALLRRRGLPGWAATVAALPVLFDAFEVQLEHMLLSDTLFIALVVVAIVVLSWNDRPSVLTAAVAGVMLGYAAITRSTGLPLLAVVAACLVVRRVGWRPTVALAGACALPVVSYMAIFQAQHGTFAMTNSDGVYLYNRVMSFADCAKIKPPPSLAILCDPRPQSQRRQPPIEYIWDSRDPINRLAKRLDRGATNPELVRGPFTPRINSLAMQFAERAILAQPLDYSGAVAADTLRSFGWANPVPYDRSNRQYLFKNFRFTRTQLREMRLYQPGMARPRVVRPIANLLIAYQRSLYVRGTLTGLIMLIGLAGIAARWRRWGGLVLLPWTCAAVLLVVPPLTAGFSMRYVLAAVPPACLAAGLAAIRQRTETASQQGGPVSDSPNGQPGSRAGDGTGRRSISQGSNFVSPPE